jgi:hypothetical protein
VKFAKHLPGGGKRRCCWFEGQWSLGFLLQERVAAILKWGTRHFKIAATLSFPSLPLRLRASVVNLDIRYYLVAGLINASLSPISDTLHPA